MKNFFHIKLRNKKLNKNIFLYYFFGRIPITTQTKMLVKNFKCENSNSIQYVSTFDFLFVITKTNLNIFQECIRKTNINRQRSTRKKSSLYKFNLKLDRSLKNEVNDNLAFGSSSYSFNW